MELKPCPVWNEGGLTYFGSPRANDAWCETEVGTLRILCEDCPNRRPIEDALAARVTALEAENARLREALRGLDEARGGCIVDPPCGGCVACDAHAALEVQP
jgi:hypothetical protein